MLTARRARISDDAADQVRRLAEDRGLRPGDRIPPERELAQLLGVGRTSIREGLRVLEIIGFVEIVPSKGVFLKADASAPLAKLIHGWLWTHRGSVQELIELREALETQAASLAAQRRTDDDLDVLAEALLGMRGVLDLEDGERFVAADDDFHDAIARAGRNPLVRRALSSINQEVQAYKLTTARLGRWYRERAVDDHERVLAALQASDPERAAAAMRQHIVQTPHDFHLLDEQPEDAASTRSESEQ